MKPALVIGNGESRKKIILNDFQNHYDLIGCNAIFRDINVNHLVCCDNRMVKEALEHPSTDQTAIYTREKYYKEHRKIFKHKNVFLLPDLPYIGKVKHDDPMHWGSGPYAVLLSCILDYEDIHLLGFDLYGINDKVNNMYKGSKNYSNQDSQSVDPAFWIYQIGKVIETYDQKNFYFYNKIDWRLPKSWQKNNVKLKLLDEFHLTLNTEPV